MSAWTWQWRQCLHALDADIVKHLQTQNLQVDIFDPWFDPAEAVHEYGLTGEAGIQLLGQPGAVEFDLKSMMPRRAADAEL